MPYAVYYEHSDSDVIRQTLFVPAINAEGVYTPPALVTRDLTPQTPSRVWNFYKDSEYSAETPSQDTRGARLGREAKQFSGLSHTMLSTFRSAQWSYVGAIVIPLGETDVADLRDAYRSVKPRVPVPVQKRISQLRIEQGFKPLPGRV